jgi:HD-GYP domain-containing protein (c-di-GMP phosphodiesterase class II)
VTERPYKKPFSPRDAVEMIMSMTEELDINVMRCFLESVILYPDRRHQADRQCHLQTRSFHGDHVYRAGTGCDLFPY